MKNVKVSFEAEIADEDLPKVCKDIQKYGAAGIQSEYPEFKSVYNFEVETLGEIKDE